MLLNSGLKFFENKNSAFSVYTNIKIFCKELNFLSKKKHFFGEINIKTNFCFFYLKLFFGPPFTLTIRYNFKKCCHLMTSKLNSEKIPTTSLYSKNRADFTIDNIYWNSPFTVFLQQWLSSLKRNYKSYPQRNSKWMVWILSCLSYLT